MKTIKSVSPNPNGGIDITDSDGFLYRGCYLKTYRLDADLPVAGIWIEPVEFSRVPGQPPRITLKVTGQTYEVGSVEKDGP